MSDNVVKGKSPLDLFYGLALALIVGLTGWTLFTVNEVSHKTIKIETTVDNIEKITDLHVVNLMHDIQKLEDRVNKLETRVARRIE